MVNRDKRTNLYREMQKSIKEKREELQRIEARKTDLLAEIRALLWWKHND